MPGKRPFILFAVIFFLVPVCSVRAAEHPGLYFNRRDLTELREQAASTKALQFSRLRRWCETHLQETPPTQIGTSERRHETCFSTITNFGICYQLTGEHKYLEAVMQYTGDPMPGEDHTKKPVL